MEGEATGIEIDSTSNHRGSFRQFFFDLICRDLDARNLHWSNQILEGNEHSTQARAHLVIVVIRKMKIQWQAEVISRARERLKPLDGRAYDVDVTSKYTANEFDKSK